MEVKQVQVTLLPLIVTPLPLNPINAQRQRSLPHSHAVSFKSVLLNSQQKKLCGKIACEFQKSSFSSYFFFFTNNRLCCLVPILPLRTTKISVKYLNVFFKLLRTTKERKNDKFKRQEKKNSREMNLAFRAHFYSGPFSTQSLVIERL